MKYLKMLGLAALSAMALMAVTAGAASATTVETNGVTQNAPVTITASLKPGTSLQLATTGGSVSNTCTAAHLKGTTQAPYSGETVTGPISELVFGSDPTDGTPGCTHDVTIHQKGTLHIKHIPGTTNGTLSSSGAEVTSFSTLVGAYINCKTGAGTTLGTYNGTTGEMAINAVLNCGFFVPSAKWEGTYVLTGNHKIGVSQ
jgi:hypothetical protein